MLKHKPRSMESTGPSFGVGLWIWRVAFLNGDSYSQLAIT